MLPLLPPPPLGKGRLACAWGTMAGGLAGGGAAGEVREHLYVPVVFSTRHDLPAGERRPRTSPCLRVDIGLRGCLCVCLVGSWRGGEGGV